MSHKTIPIQSHLNSKVAHVKSFNKIRSKLIRAWNDVTSDEINGNSICCVANIERVTRFCHSFQLRPEQNSNTGASQMHRYYEDWRLPTLAVLSSIPKIFRRLVSMNLCDVFSLLEF